MTVNADSETRHLQVEMKERAAWLFISTIHPEGARQQSVGDISGRNTGFTLAKALGTIHGHGHRDFAAALCLPGQRGRVRCDLRQGARSEADLLGRSRAESGR